MGKSVAPRAHFGYNYFIMKKTATFILLILVVTALAFALAACNNATTQGQLVDAWKNARPYERYTYTVDDSAYEGTEGTYVSEIIYYAAYDAEENTDKVTVGDYSFEQREGYLIKSTLNASIDGKKLLFETACYFALTDGRNYLLPYATLRSETVDGKQTFRMNGVYSGSTLEYTLTADGETKSGSVGLGSPYYDNNEFHQSLRGVSTFSSSFSFGFSTAAVNATEQTSVSLTFSVSGTEEVKDLPFPSLGKDDEDKEVQNATTALNCYCASLSRATTVAGASQRLYYTVDPVYAAKNAEGTHTSLSTYARDDMWALPHVLVKIVEPYNDADRNEHTVTYTLQDISLIPDAE